MSGFKGLFPDPEDHFTTQQRLDFIVNEYKAFQDSQRRLIFEVQRLTEVLTSFLIQSQASGRLFTKQDEEKIRKAKTEGERRKVLKIIFTRIAASPKAKTDRELNGAFWKTWEPMPLIERVKFLYNELTLPRPGRALSVIELHRKFHDPALRPKPAKQNALSPLEQKLYNFCNRHGIDLSKSAGEIRAAADDKDFKNLKGKNILIRSTVSKMLKKMRT